MLTWNRRLSKAGMGVNRSTHHGPKIAIPPDPSLEYLRFLRVRKDRSANGYRTGNKFTEGSLQETTTFWVQDTRSGDKVTDPAILADVLRVVNSAEKWKRKPGRSSYRWGGETKYKPRIVFDKPGPGELDRHNLGLACECLSCKPKPETTPVIDNVQRLRLLDESNARRRGWTTF